ncbi:uncharacterized membrane protein YvlD (DUF360 family) [Geomicrobium halophilum]|uniref:Uncharacterized membrane protein YvlD (DUF360 family) n=1 Tax=Geomicrobium halophilum TaxID=549000 RepID=A0A841PPN0_9BACL|nr:uncharacterized membrane protein YvlD (DUF360 family) [Geomicrobium halophilum]
MNYTWPLIIKFIMMTVVLWIVLGLFGASFVNILLISILLTLVSYMLGDLFILPNYGNLWATVADFGLAFIGVWALGSFFDQIGFWAAFISAIVIAIGEAFFHWFMNQQVLEDEEPIRNDMSERNLQTEFGSDMDVKSDAEKANKNKNQE